MNILIIYEITLIYQTTDYEVGEYPTSYKDISMISATIPSIMISP